VDALGINLGFFIAQLVNFGIIFLLLAKLVWPRVLKMLDERSERIAKGLEDARAAEEARANAERERDKLLAQARAEAQKVLEEARQRGEEQLKQMLREAQAEAEKVREQARAQAEEERNRILAEARDDIVALALAAAERLVGETLDEKRQKAVLKRFFAGVPAEAKGLGDRVIVISAVPLADDEKAEVLKVTGAKEVEYRVDPSILGGLILRAGDKVVDGSVRGDLSALSLALR
jgi:F-type H+-transporting ATPase subunit b